LSVASVSRALNGHANVHPDTRARIVAVATKLGYVPNAAARSLSTSRSNAIGVVLPDFHGEFFSEIMRGMDRVASVHGYQLLLSNMHADSDMAAHAIGAMRGRVDGLVVMAPQLASATLLRTLPIRLPTVLINTHDGIGRHNIHIDNRLGAARAVEHLLATGRRNIIHIAGAADNIDGYERCEGFKAAVQKRAPHAPLLVFEGDFQDSAGDRIVQSLLKERCEFDAIFAANDMMALGAIRALRAANIDVPGQVSVIGFDDIPLARYLSLTTLRVDMAGVGGRAIERLLDEISNGALPPGTEIITPELVMRGSTLPGE
jgi:LacI family transcriptional regulator